ncbi:MAG: DUF3144 domain-containing protein [Gammaproteobacteria bacterium]|jgi:hypothetical protein|nr:DUF3144 domain-containing protein [Gammaproteobacteria bacterium]
MDENLITEEELDSQFKEMIDSFIDQANELSKQNHIENVSLALLHAASRYNAYVVSNHATSLTEYESELDKARSFFMSNYDDMLNENLQDYKKIFMDDFKYQHLMK